MKIKKSEMYVVEKSEGNKTYIGESITINNRLCEHLEDAIEHYGISSADVIKKELKNLKKREPKARFKYEKEIYKYVDKAIEFLNKYDNDKIVGMSEGYVIN